MSGLTSTPPLKPAIGVSRASGPGQHRHAARRPAAGDGKADTRLAQSLDGRDRPWSEDLVFGDESAVDVGEEQFQLRDPVRHLSQLLASPSRTVAFHRLGEPLVLVAVRHGAGRRLHRLARIAHRDAEAGDLEHRRVVGAVADGEDPVDRDPEVAGDALDRHALVHTRHW